MALLQGGKGETPVLRSTGGVQAEYSGVRVEYSGVQRSIAEYSRVQRSTAEYEWSTSVVQAEYSGVQAEYVKYGGVLEYRSSAFSPLPYYHFCVVTTIIVPHSQRFPRAGCSTDRQNQESHLLEKNLINAIPACVRLSSS
jgi:hypothetical protein